MFTEGLYPTTVILAGKKLPGKLEAKIVWGYTKVNARVGKSVGVHPGKERVLYSTHKCTGKEYTPIAFFQHALLGHDHCVPPHYFNP